MRAELVLVCVALCLAVTMARPPFGGGRGRKGSGEGRRGRGGCTSVCSLTNNTSSVNVTAECKDGFECSPDSLDFTINADQFAASFCVRVEEDESPETTQETPIEPVVEDEPETEMFVKFLLRRACRVVNGTTGEVEKSRRCPRGLQCFLSGVTVEVDGQSLEATYCQDDQQTIGWMQVFNGRRKGQSSEESSDESSDEDDSGRRGQGFGGRGFGGFGRHRRDAGEEFRGGPCNITDSDGVEIESSACPEESACAVGPIVAEDNGAAINIFFCEKPERPSSESSESSEEGEDEEAEDDDENDDDDEDYYHIARKMFCNACSLSKNGTDVETRVTCDDCSAGPISTLIHGTEVVAKFCSTGEDFSLIQALRCRGRGGRGRKGPGGRKGRKPEGRKSEGKKPRGHKRG